MGFGRNISCLLGLTSSRSTIGIDLSAQTGKCRRGHSVLCWSENQAQRSASFHVSCQVLPVSSCKELYYTSSIS
jgi:hypothetical protein